MLASRAVTSTRRIARALLLSRPVIATSCRTTLAALSKWLAPSIPANREVIHVIPRGYVVDGQEGIKNPIGMSGFRLEVETHIITGAVSSIHNLIKCVHKARVEIEDLVLEPLASSEAVLAEGETDLGVALVDIGGGTTDVAVFSDGAIWQTAVLPIGGNLITSDIAIGLRLPPGVAEELK